MIRELAAEAHAETLPADLTGLRRLLRGPVPSGVRAAAARVLEVTKR